MYNTSLYLSLTLLGEPASKLFEETEHHSGRERAG